VPSAMACGPPWLMMVDRAEPSSMRPVRRARLHIGGPAGRSVGHCPAKNKPGRCPVREQEIGHVVAIVAPGQVLVRRIADVGDVVAPGLAAFLLPPLKLALEVVTSVDQLQIGALGGDRVEAVVWVSELVVGGV